MLHSVAGHIIETAMLTIAELRQIPRARLADAESLLEAKRYDSAAYLCGYAVELALKARICRTLHWEGFPEAPTEFRDLQSFRTHDLAVLLHLSGIQGKVKTQFLSQWAAISLWNPESRYNPVGSTSPQDAALMIEAAKVFARVL